MKKIIMLILILSVIVNAGIFTFYTKTITFNKINSSFEEYFKNPEQYKSEYIQTNINNRSKWTLNVEAGCFIHNTNDGDVKESTYWIDKSTVTDLETGIGFFATSDAGITRLFYFTTTAISILYENDDNTIGLIIFPVYNYKQEE